MLGGPGQWLLALPTHHVAGLQVLARSALAGTSPVTLDPGASFTSTALAAATARLDPRQPHYASLVPTQLHRALGAPEGIEALRQFDTILLGGAAADPVLLDRARAAGVCVVTTYGMSETCGGCVYDGTPLPGVRVRLDADGRIHLGGPVLADGYVGRTALTAERFLTDDEGVRWFVTDDRGVCRAGRLHVRGRVDDVVVTGGRKVDPADVEAALRALPGIGEALVVGVPDPEWGQRVAALVTLADGADERSDPGTERGGRSGAEVRAELRRAGGLPAHAVARQVEVVDAIPLLDSGKPDRHQARTILARGGRMTPDPH